MSKDLQELVEFYNRHKWRKCSESLPEEGVMVLTFGQDKKQRWGYIAFHGGWETEREGMEWDTGVTHWMPMPDLPGENE